MRKYPKRVGCKNVVKNFDKYEKFQVFLTLRHPDVPLRKIRMTTCRNELFNAIYNLYTFKGSSLKV